MVALPARTRGYIYSALSLMLLAVSYVLNIRMREYASTTTYEWREEDFSYLEEDYPPSLIPLSKHPRDAMLIIEDTVHYPPNASAEWASIFPAGSGGFVRLGPRGRLFGVSMFHQLHCLDKMRRAVVAPPSSEWESWHTQHCLNYVRQMLLCAANTRLEPVKEVVEQGENREAKVDGLGLEHRCRDWSVLRTAVEENFRGWEKYDDE
ncbi:hypothetical protein GY45DRAFT_1263194 [Cubamyces sp. BRFM 1775]|nr:hypothetical protein GY45DRAFT_1263194 [Cubamyces sp. BRFM 1775]